MAELTLVLGILDKIASLMLVLAQGASAEQKVILLNQHIVITKPLYDLLSKIEGKVGA
jgi:hypothetical protein